MHIRGTLKGLGSARPRRTGEWRQAPGAEERPRRPEHLGVSEELESGRGGRLGQTRDVDWPRVAQYKSASWLSMVTGNRQPHRFVLEAIDPQTECVAVEVKDLQSNSSGKSGSATRIVLYALPQQAWRIDAYLMLQDAAAKSGWNEGFERMQGSLLGYEDWQNDVFVEQCYRPAVRSRRAS